MQYERMMAMKKLTCNIIEEDYLTLEYLGGLYDSRPNEDGNMVDLQIFDKYQHESMGVTLSLQSVRELAKELQEYIVKAESIGIY
jgi:hypothetical protein